MPSLMSMYPRYSISSAQNVDFSALTFKPALQSCLRTLSSFSRWSARLFLEIQRSYLSKLVRTLGIPLALTFSLGICLENLQCPLVISCRNIFPKERQWGKNWMHLDPI
jgi:hypothetical protein